MAEPYDLPPIPPDGEVGTRHVIEDVPFGWDVVIEVRQLRPDLCECGLLRLALAHLAAALEALGVDPVQALEEGADTRLDDPDDDWKGVYE